MGIRVSDDVTGRRVKEREEGNTQREGVAGKMAATRLAGSSIPV